MRVAVAGFLHETNTFAPVPADLAAFQRGGGYIPLSHGAEILRRGQNVNLGISGALRVARLRDWDVVPLTWAGAIPSAPVTDAAFDHVLGRIISDLRAAGPVDGVFLDLHGAMVTDGHDDGEKAVLDAVRSVVGPDVPIVAALDLHGNISEGFARGVQALVGFRTYPHVDMAETGARAAELLHQIMVTGMRPACGFRRMDYLVPIPFQSTDMAPARDLYARLPDIEQGGVKAASLFMGFPAADIPDCGPVAVTYADTQDGADRAADQIARAYDLAEAGFEGRAYQPIDAIAEATRLSEAAAGPVVIADTQDNPGAGGVSATTGMLRALIAADVRGAAIGLIVDPVSAARAHSLGQGAVGDFEIGGHPGVPGDLPVATRAEVVALSDGRFAATGPYYGGTEMDLGPSACLRVGGVDVVVTSAIAQMADREMFRFVGIVPERMRVLVVKSSTHFRADFAPIAAHILVAKAPGPMPLDPADLPFTRLRPGLRLSPNGPAFTPTPARKTQESPA